MKDIIIDEDKRNDDVDGGLHQIMTFVGWQKGVCWVGIDDSLGLFDMNFRH